MRLKTLLACGLMVLCGLCLMGLSGCASSATQGVLDQLRNEKAELAAEVGELKSAKSGLQTKLADAIMSGDSEKIEALKAAKEELETMLEQAKTDLSTKVSQAQEVELQAASERHSNALASLGLLQTIVGSVAGAGVLGGGAGRVLGAIS